MTDIIQVQESESDVILRQAVAVIDKSNGGNNNVFCHWHGTLALMSTSGKDAEHVYLDYKTRGDVEQAIDAFKNVIEADHSYMQDEKSLEAWTFICMIALTCRSRRP